MRLNTQRRRRAIKALIERDGLACCFCGHRIPLDAPENSPLQMTIEHCVPVAKGGSNSLSNLKLAHHHCNLKAGRFLERQMEAMR